MFLWKEQMNDESMEGLKDQAPYWDLNMEDDVDSVIWENALVHMMENVAFLFEEDGIFLPTFRQWHAWTLQRQKPQQSKQPTILIFPSGVN